MTATNRAWMTTRPALALGHRRRGLIDPARLRMRRLLRANVAQDRLQTAQRANPGAAEAHRRHRRGEVNPTLRAIKHPADGLEMRPSQLSPVIELLEVAS
jgi:hypothetical protein